MKSSEGTRRMATSLQEPDTQGIGRHFGNRPAGLFCAALSRDDRGRRASGLGSSRRGS